MITTRTLRLLSIAAGVALTLLSLPLLIVAMAPATTTWSDFSPGFDDWIGELPATVAVSAHSPDGLTDSAAYQISTDGGASWSGWRTENLQVGPQLGDSRRITVTGLALAEGANFVQFRITDASSQSSSSPAFPVNVDTTAPASPIAATAVPATWTNINDFGAAWTNPSDPNGVAGVWRKFGAAPLAPADGLYQPGTDIDNLSGLQAPGEGAQTLWLWLQDGLGHVDHQTAVSVTLKLDVTPPAGLADPVVDPAAWTNTNAFDLQWTPPDDVSGLSGVRAKVGAAPITAAEGDYLDGAETGYPGYAIPNDVEGIHPLWLWPVDGAGNIGDPAQAVSVTLKLDLTPPGPPLTLPAVSPSGWQTATTATYTVTWTNPTDLSGVAGACYKLGSEPEHDVDGTCEDGENIESITGITAPAPGSYHLFLWLGDAAGNIDKNSRRVALDALKWDPAAPELFVDAIGPIGENDWYTGPIEISIIASDVGSGLDSVAYNLDESEWIEDQQLTIAEDGQHVLQLRAADKAGNHTEPEPLSFDLDQEPPATDPSLDRLPVFEDWYDAPVTVWFNPMDLISGPDYVEWQLDDGDPRRDGNVLIEEEGEHLLQFHSVDLAGNQENVQELQINVDSLPPVTSYVILPGDNNEGWHTEPVTVTLVPADDGAGVEATYYRIDAGEWISGTQFSLMESGEYDVEFYSIDRLGHKETPYGIPGGIRIDTEAPRAPTPIDVAPHGWTQSNDFDLVLAMPPDLSGIAGAFYKVGEPPSADDDGTRSEGSNNVIHHVQTPAEGVFKAYVWLEDGAGNVDHTRRGVWEDALSLAYDATPPTTTALLDGEPGENDWFISPVRVTLVATDALSGVDTTYVSIDGSQPVPTTEFVLSASDKHTIRFHSADIAGNIEDAVFETIRIDPDPPGAPQAVAVSPADWSQTNSFTLTWTNPPDTSGIAAGYYKLGQPPLHPRDGVRIPPIGVAQGITVPQEGAWDLFFWLEDHAGNGDLAAQVTLSRALRYDNTPPTTTATVRKGDLAPSGWYITPVTIELEAADVAAGVDHLRYRLDGGEWSDVSGPAATVEIGTTGQHVLDYQAIDAAGNTEQISSSSFKIDLHAPIPSFLTIDRYQRQPSFVLRWQAVDEAKGSGLDGFDLQSKDGRNGAWQNWGASNIPDTSGRYFGNYGHRYFFRLRAHDVAGNISQWVELPWGVYIDAVLNGDFAGGSFGAWTHEGELVQQVIRATDANGAEAFVARLGSPDYGPNVPGMDIPPDSTGSVPVGAGRILQTVRVPGADVLDHPTLTFWYRIFTYDTAFGGSQQRWFDTLDLKLIGPTGEQLALREGLPYEEWQEGKLADLGWREAVISLPQAWAGEALTIRIENWNRVDGRLNTWSLVSDVRLWEPYHLFLPQISNSGVSTSAARPRALDDPGLRRPPGGLR